MGTAIQTQGHICRASPWPSSAAPLRSPMSPFLVRLPSDVFGSVVAFLHWPYACLLLSGLSHDVRRTWLAFLSGLSQDFWRKKCLSLHPRIVEVRLEIGEHLEGADGTRASANTWRAAYERVRDEYVSICKHLEGADCPGGLLSEVVASVEDALFDLLVHDDEEENDAFLRCIAVDHELRRDLLEAAYWDVQKQVDWEIMHHGWSLSSVRDVLPAILAVFAIIEEARIFSPEHYEHLEGDLLVELAQLFESKWEPKVTFV